PELAIAVVEADDPVRLADQPLDEPTRAARRPVGIVGEKVVNRVDVDTGWIVVELEAVREFAPHARSLAKPLPLQPRRITRLRGIREDRGERCSARLERRERQRWIMRAPDLSERGGANRGESAPDRRSIGTISVQTRS